MWHPKNHLHQTSKIIPFFNNKNPLKFDKQKFISSLGGELSDVSYNLYSDTKPPFKDHDIDMRWLMGRVYTDGRSYGAITEAKGNNNDLINKYKKMSSIKWGHLNEVL